ncbi:MAG: uracil-DNA glycosylase [Ignavibacteriae bacterium]|nr:uracil-DNA glycosylase [Ignavibacteriota bacterium]MCB9210390.1 uracil-DNA glycosylase [Ignavibacteriales bacterium]MCB9219195.1 uracil-DNA glycosylase [Ignavibacteriales bacterium]MCB9259777.1 uracil-DNA glycosylase [Ignavibacteriales bacterium]
MNNTINLLIEAIKDQKEIFGDELFETFTIESRIEEPKNLIHEQKPIFMPSNNLFEEFAKCETIDSLYNTINECQKCALGKTRTKFVFGTGNPTADVMIIGEAPGADEDKQGIPFVGRAGKLLTDILKAINFEREEVYIANILKCRPPNNRNPLPAEMEECTPYLYKQIELIKPKVILCLGLVAASSLLNQKVSLTKLRGNVYDIQGIKTMVTYHPAALLRNPNWKRGCWEDVQKFRKLYDSLS